MSIMLQTFCAWVTLMVVFVLITAPIMLWGKSKTAESVAVLAALAALGTLPMAMSLYMYLTSVCK